jgi:hypothetical protein
MPICNVHKKTGLLILGLLYVILFPVGATSVHAQTAKEQISTEIVHLKKILASLNLSEEDSQRYLKQLDRTAETLQSGYLYLSLSYLQEVEVELISLQYQQASSNIAQQGNEGFEKEWQRLGGQLSEGEKTLIANRFRQMPVAVKALVEISQSQIQPYYKSGRLFGLNTTIKDGLYYLGKALANLNFAIYCQHLNFSQPLSGAKGHSLERQLQQAEMETVKAFQQAETAAKQQRFIPVNSSLKMAWELNRDRSFSGALFQYLNICLRLGLIKDVAVSEKRFLELQKQSETMGGRLSSSKTDHSVGLLYWQMAQQALQNHTINKADSETLKRAAVILEQVLPRYFKYLAEVR